MLSEQTRMKLLKEWADNVDNGMEQKAASDLFYAKIHAATLELDAEDSAIVQSRQSAFLANVQPKQGDYVRFADGTLRRISHVLRDENDQPKNIQTSAGGSFYLGDGFMSFSGSLYAPVPFASFTRTEETIAGRAWIFHHNYVTAHNGQDVTIQCPVWNCNLPANK